MRILLIVIYLAWKHDMQIFAKYVTYYVIYPLLWLNKYVNMRI